VLGETSVGMCYTDGSKQQAWKSGGIRENQSINEEPSISPSGNAYPHTQRICLFPSTLRRRVTRGTLKSRQKGSNTVAGRAPTTYMKGRAMAAIMGAPPVLAVVPLKDARVRLKFRDWRAKVAVLGFQPRFNTLGSGLTGRADRPNSRSSFGLCC
jgi:hypothetical protein